jgi:hypothetical protein
VGSTFFFTLPKSSHVVRETADDGQTVSA